MTNHELREKIEKIILRHNPNYNYLGQASDELLEIVKELGYTRQHRHTPEYKPVELEALGDEEIRNCYNTLKMKPPEWIPEIDHQVSQATLRKNQKGQLFRVKEN